MILIIILFLKGGEKVLFHAPRNEIYDVCCCFILFILRSIATENGRSYYGEWTRACKSVLCTDPWQLKSCHW